MEREEAARRFAGVMGWEYVEDGVIDDPDCVVGPALVVARYPGTEQPPIGEPSADEVDWFEFPAPDAPLHEHLAFVGRVTEAIRADWVIADWRSTMRPPSVTFGLATGEAPDLSHAALLAAIAAKE